MLRKSRPKTLLKEQKSPGFWNRVIHSRGRARHLDVDPVAVFPSDETNMYALNCPRYRRTYPIVRCERAGVQVRPPPNDVDPDRVVVFVSNRVPVSVPSVPSRR